MTTRCDSYVNLPADDPYASTIVDCELPDGHTGGHEGHVIAAHGKHLTAIQVNLTW